MEEGGSPVHQESPQRTLDHSLALCNHRWRWISQTTTLWMMQPMVIRAPNKRALTRSQFHWISTRVITMTTRTSMVNSLLSHPRSQFLQKISEEMEKIRVREALPTLSMIRLTPRAKLLILKSISSPALVEAQSSLEALRQTKMWGLRFPKRWVLLNRTSTQYSHDKQARSSITVLLNLHLQLKQATRLRTQTRWIRIHSLSCHIWASTGELISLQWPMVTAWMVNL